MDTPWTISKVFPDSCVIDPWVRFNEHNIANLDFQFSLNGEIRQNSSTKNMMFDPVELIIYASQFFPLCPSDIFFTGTSAGVGQVRAGDIGVLQLDNNYNYTVRWEKC